MMAPETLLDGDTQNVLNRRYASWLIQMGLPSFETPIFDALAADRFSRPD